MALHVEAVQLEYATPRPILGAAYRSLFAQLLILSVLSGLCVGSCFLLGNPLIFGLPHMAIFAATIGLALKSGRSLQLLTGASGVVFNAAFLLDIGALFGLAMLALAPIPIALEEQSPTAMSILTGLGALAYGLLTIGSVRHVALYRTLAGIARESAHVTMAKWLKALGYVKTVYEGLWLGCCASALFLITINKSGSIDIANDVLVALALGALFGAMGFVGIWIWMIVAHALLLRLAHKSAVIEPMPLTRPSA